MNKVRLEKLICNQEGLSSFSRASLEKLQLEKLNMQLERASGKGGYYVNFPSHLDSLSQLSSLPFTSADSVAADFSAFCLCNAAEIARIRTDFSSGTTGAPKRMAYSEYDCRRTEAFFVNGLSEIVFPHDKVLVCMPASDRFSLGGLIRSAVEELSANAFTYSPNTSFREYLKIINTENVNVYIGPPTLLLSLLRLGARFDRAVVSGDILSEKVKTICNSMLPSPVTSHYGLREAGLGCAFECDAHSGLHVRENDIICEIISEDGKPVNAGESGELVVTTIGMDAMPLFRYRTGDFARIVDGPCPCGSDLIRIEILGRLSQNTISAYDNILFSFDDVIDYKVTDKSVIISLLNLDPAVSSTASAVFADKDIFLKRTLLTDKPMYIGKRVIIMEDH